ncbi:beta-galactosidase [Halalkalibacter urbisdiaboli]|uniref:beta-galactosidase n=1 Tax=Halalkalibacter urbisdiaboli TaxID=1960589 RepID=UPI000B441E59|nr:beta-galactosidase [Halalkalibacter urbisdiaboli]
MLQNKEFQLGVCYYPEHWPENMWENDFKRMKEMGFSIVRMAEFAWSIFEPNEGEFSFEFFDRVIDICNKYGLKVVLGTPTATPPAWLTHKYPEVLNASQEGINYQHGQRRHYNYNSSIYKDLSARIVKEMVTHYKDHPAVVGWQIDNELNCETDVFYSEADHRSFRTWVKEKYQTLKELNNAWGTVFWSQTYTDWEQVFLPRKTVSDSPNPHQALDEKRFISDSAISFAGVQQKIIKELAPHQWVTTNGIFGHIDNHQMTSNLLDFIAYDSYPNFGNVITDDTPNPLLDRRWSWNLSVVRSISPTFAVFEQQSGGGGWVNRLLQPAPKPGQMRLWTYQSIAHGADRILYFRWRTATMGTEIYWHGINDYHNQPNRRVKEAEQIGKELKRIGDRLVCSKYRAEVAIVKDYDNEWDGELDKWHGSFEKKSLQAWFKAFQYSHIPADALYIHNTTSLDELLKYKILVYPHPTILPETRAELLKEYVRQGGKIIFGCRSGYKNINGQCYMLPFPGPIGDLCGITIEDYTLIGPKEEAPVIELENQKANGLNDEIKANDFNEIINPYSSDAEVLARFKGSFYSGKPALVKNTYGQGEAYYFGGVFNEELTNQLVDRLEIHSPVDWIKLPKAIEISIREHPENGEKFIFLLNFSNEKQTIEIRKTVHELITNSELSGEVSISSYGVFILKVS